MRGIEARLRARRAAPDRPLGRALRDTSAGRPMSATGHAPPFHAAPARRRRCSEFLAPRSIAGHSKGMCAFIIGGMAFVRVDDVLAYITGTRD